MSDLVGSGVTVFSLIDSPSELEELSTLADVAVDALAISIRTLTEECLPHNPIADLPSLVDVSDRFLPSPAIVEGLLEACACAVLRA
jgi:hypothetical protein